MQTAASRLAFSVTYTKIQSLFFGNFLKFSLKNLKKYHRSLVFEKFSKTKGKNRKLKKNTKIRI